MGSIVHRWMLSALLFGVLVAKVAAVILPVVLPNAIPGSSSPDSLSPLDQLLNRLWDAQRVLVPQISLPPVDDSVLSWRFFNFHARHAVRIGQDLRLKIDNHEIPKSLADQQDLAIRMQAFIKYLSDFRHYNWIRRANISRIQTSTDAFPVTNAIFADLDTLVRQAQTYLNMLTEHMHATRASQLAKDLQDLDSLTKSRIYGFAPHM